MDLDNDPIAVEVPIKVTFVDTVIHNGLKIGYEETEKVLHLFDPIVTFRKDSSLIGAICDLYLKMREYILDYIEENTKGE